jgi:hypothetical protein
MDIVAVTAKLSKEYETRSALRTFIKSKNEDIQHAEKWLRQANNELDFNEVQIVLLETLIKRPDGVKIEAVKRPSFQCDCPECNPQKAQEPIPTAAEPTPTKVAPAKKPAKRSKK